MNTVKNMYSENVIVADTTEGFSKEVDLKQGIRQGCPMSPILFALYMDWVTEQLKLLGIHRQGEPTMLAYADDILVWGYTVKEMEEKLKVVMQALEELGLRVSSKKSILQVNSWGVGKLQEVKDKDQWVVKLQNEVVRIPITRPPASFKYLGVWLNADSSCQENLDKLGEKVKGRLDIIESLRANPLTKAMLIKSRVVSVIDYSLGVHNAPMKWVVDLDRRIGNIISKAMGRMANCRRDLLYEPMELGGLGMVRLQDQYWKNRARVMVQLIKSGERTVDRGQEGWMVQMIREELGMEESSMDVVDDFKSILGKLNMEVIYRAEDGVEQVGKLGRWAFQAQKVARHREGKGNVLCMRNSGLNTAIPWGKYDTINVAILEWFQQMGGGNMAKLGQLVQGYVDQRKKEAKERSLILNSGVQMSEGLLEWVVAEGQGWGEIITNLSDRLGLFMVTRSIA